MAGLSKRELLLSLKNATIEACFSVPMLNLTLSQFPFVIGFAVQALAWRSGAIGLLAAVYHLANAAQPPLTNFLQRRFSTHRIMVWGFLLNALPWAFVWVLPWIGRFRDVTFLAIVIVATLANSVCSVAWSAAMSVLVPLSIRGRYFGTRNLIFGFWTLLAVLVAGFAAQHWNSSLHVFGVIYAVAAGARLIGLFFLRRMKFPAPVMERRQQAESLADYLRVFRDWNYVWLMLFVGLWGFALNLGMPFYNVFVLRELPMRMGHLTVLMTLSSLGGLVALRSWGTLSDRFGNKPVLFAAALLWALTALPAWLLVGPKHYHHLYVAYFLAGFMTAGFQLAQFNLMLKMVPTESKAHYISVFLAVTSLLTAAGPLVGGRLLLWLPQQLGTLAGQPLLRFHLLFAGSFILALIVLHVIHLMAEPAERPVGELVRVMRNMREFNPMLGFISLAQFMFTPRGLSRFARASLRSVQQSTKVGEELVGVGWRRLRQPFAPGDKTPPAKRPPGPPRKPQPGS